MKRVKLAAALIALILTVGTGSVLYTYHSTQELTAMLQEIRQAALEEDAGYVADLCGEYNQVWHKKERVMTKLLRHHPIDSVTELSAQLETFARYGETIMLLSTLDQLEESVHHIWEEERPTLLNIL